MRTVIVVLDVLSSLAGLAMAGHKDHTYFRLASVKAFSMTSPIGCQVRPSN